MRPLSARVSDQVNVTVRNRGHLLFQRGMVHLHKRNSQSRLNGFVIDTQATCNFHLRLELGTLFSACSCEHVRRNKTSCEHIWAAILKSDQKKYLSDGMSSTLNLNVDKLDAAAIQNINITAASQDDLDDEDLYDEFEDDEFDDDDEEEDEDIKEAERFGRPIHTKDNILRMHPLFRQQAAKATPPEWKRRLAEIQAASRLPSHSIGEEAFPPGRELGFIIDVAATKKDQSGMVVCLAYRDRKLDGEWGKFKMGNSFFRYMPELPDPLDRQIVSLLKGASSTQQSYYDSSRFLLQPVMNEIVVPLMCKTGRCRLQGERTTDDPQIIEWDDGPPWELCIEVQRDKHQNYRLTGTFRRGEEKMPMGEPLLLLEGGMIFARGRAARLNDFNSFCWIPMLRQTGSLTIPASQVDDLQAEILACNQLPRMELPEEIRFEQVRVTPKPRLMVKPIDSRVAGSDLLAGELSFDYDGTIVGADVPGQSITKKDRRCLILRDKDSERAAAAMLHQLGFRLSAHSRYGESILELGARHFPRAASALLAAQWHVESDGNLYRRSDSFRMEVKSGIDWFELHGGVKFGESEAPFPALLAAVKRGENMVRLSDGSFGLLPDEWVKKYGMLAGLGDSHDGHLRFKRSQTGLLDVLLAAQPQATCDATFVRLRDELRNFSKIEPGSAPASFTGTLRAYQSEGLGWFDFLRRFNFGGCLADDMGLGKTVQVLALLDSRRQQAPPAGETRLPSLVVVPRSLVFNWKQEAARFAPELKILDHTGARTKGTAHFNDFDTVLTTYGTLRNDALHFKDAQFDYVILDEAQAVKNSSTESAKAVRLLRGQHRLALSGTPIENHMGELWSLFEFINPGMLGSAAVFRACGAGAKEVDQESRMVLARALKPFILRRTKDQVAKDLPQKLEQTIFCELEPEQRKLYDELKEHYRAALLGRIEKEGLNKSKIQVLEALLRLRQAACHPGLLDKSKVDDPSAKLDMLLPQLTEVLGEGHKALVFSQFTSFLAILRKRLDKDKVPYAYLDGQTRDRKSCVDQFQNDADCKLFLISLKAGGLGLNLTAAEYVFLLDPWWNPAVEAQAIDRAHRIGQSRQVFAYRLIAKNTVEEKVLALQQTKRDLADAILNADNSLIRNLSREDLELLLS